MKVPRVQLGNYLAKLERCVEQMHTRIGSNVWHLDRVLSVPQIDLSAHTDRKMVILYVNLRICTKKTQFYSTDTQIKKLRWFSFECKGITFAHCPMCICISVYFLELYSICLLAVWPVSVSYRHLTVGIFGLVFFVL